MRMDGFKRYVKISSCMLLSIITSGCMVGPDFHSPKAPQTTTYTEYPQSKKTISVPLAKKAGKAQTFIAGRDIPADWWRLFHSKEINALICKGLHNSPNLAAAEAALRQAHETWIAQIGASLFPAVTANFSGERQRGAGGSSSGSSSSSAGSSGSSGGSSSSIFNLYNASVGVTYTLDVFGGARRQIESLHDQMENERFQLEAAYLTLTSNIVTSSITIASLREQIVATRDLIHSQQQQLTIVKNQFVIGGASRADIYTQESQLQQTRATLPPLEQKLAVANHALSVLIGELPSQDAIPRFRLDRLTLPTELPISIPSLLVRQRPDIRASEALLASASAQIGVATANMYPQITLNANDGWSAATLGQLFRSQNNIWSFGGALAQPIFNAGSLLAKKRAAVAAFDQAFAQYQETVLQAFQNVADTLRALQHDAETLRDQKASEIAAYRALKLVEQQFQLGGVSYLALLISQRQYQTARISRIQAEAARYNDTAALFQALGGGWWNRG